MGCAGFKGSEMESNERATERLFRLPEVLHKFPVSKSTWFAGIKAGKYPRGVKLSSRCVAWRESDIIALIEQTRGAE
jgi:prophage regulatory protein